MPFGNLSSSSRGRHEWCGQCSDNSDSKVKNRTDKALSIWLTQERGGLLTGVRIHCDADKGVRGQEVHSRQTRLQKGTACSRNRVSMAREETSKMSRARRRQAPPHRGQEDYAVRRGEAHDADMQKGPRAAMGKMQKG